MHKVFWIGVVIAVATVCTVSGAEQTNGVSPGLDGINAQEMTIGEMDDTDGSLFARGARRRRRTRRLRWRGRAARTDRVHCDIIARNRAESMGFDTSSPNGRFGNYNHVTVSQIYGNHRSNRHSTPPRGTAGYIFTGGANGKSHLQFYDNRSGGNTYTRYSNGSYPGTESTYQAYTNYRPEDVSRQSFVPLPRRDHRTVWSW